MHDIEPAVILVIPITAIMLRFFDGELPAVGSMVQKKGTPSKLTIIRRVRSGTLCHIPKLDSRLPVPFRTAPSDTALIVSL